MALIQAILLGIIEGLTEFLPISSTGHLVVAERLIGFKDAAEMFTVVIQVGAIAAVIWYYREQIWQKVTGLFDGNKSTQKFWVNWIVATIPAGLAGLAFNKHLEQFATPGVVGITLILGGILILLIEKYHRPKPAKSEPQMDNITLGQSMKIGLYQILSLIPGVSRSGSTIMGGLISGLDRVTATAFSFFMSIPILVLASGYKLVADRDKLASVPGGGSALLAGTIAAFVVAFVSVKWLLRYVSKHDFKPFAYYRILLGLTILMVMVIY